MAKRYVYTLSQIKRLNKLLTKNIDVILEKIAKDTVNKIRVYIKQYWYDVYEPTIYERSYSLLKAIDYSIEDGTISIFINEDILEYSSQKPWGTHVGFDGDSFGEGLIEFIENGVYNSGKTGSKANPRVGKGSRALARTRKWLDKYLNKEIQKQIKFRLGNTTV